MALILDFRWHNILCTQIRIFQLIGMYHSLFTVDLVLEICGFLFLKCYLGIVIHCRQNI